MVVVNALTAAKVGDLETLKRLDLSLKEDLTDRNGASCVHYAARGGSLPVLEYLIKSCNFSEFQRTRTGATAMHDAAARGNTAVLKWFLDNTELTVDDKDGVGISALHLAAQYRHFLTVEWLLDEAESDSSIRTASDALPLHFAVVGGDLNCVKILIDENPRQINMQMINGSTPIYLACQNGCLEVLQYLVSRNGATKIKAYDAMSCLHAAAQMGHLDIVKWLVKEEKMNPNDRDFDGATPLHYAASMGQYHVVKWLLQEGGAKVTLDNLGGSPLHTAAEFGEVQTIQALLECGCDKTLTDNDGLTATELAEKCEQEAAAVLISEDKEHCSTDKDISPRKVQEDVTELPPRTIPLHSPRLSFPPPPSYPPEGDLNLNSVTTTGVNTSFLDFEARSPSPPLPPPPVYSPTQSTPPSLGSPITPPTPINVETEEVPSGLADPSADVVDYGGEIRVQQRRSRISGDSTASNFGVIEQKNAKIIQTVTAEVHYRDPQGASNNSLTSSSNAVKANSLPPPVLPKSVETYDKLQRNAVVRKHSITPYDVVELYPSESNSSRKIAVFGARRPTTFKDKIDNQYSYLEIGSASELSTSADSVLSIRSVDTVTSAVSPTSPKLSQEDITDHFAEFLDQRSSGVGPLIDDREKDSNYKPSSVAHFKALFEKRTEGFNPPWKKSKEFSSPGKLSNMEVNSSESSRRSSRSSVSLATTQPLKEQRQPGKYTSVIVNGKHTSDISNGKPNGGLASHAAAIAAVARNSQRYDSPSEDSSPAASSNVNQPESNSNSHQSNAIQKPTPLQNGTQPAQSSTSMSSTTSSSVVNASNQSSNVGSASLSLGVNSKPSVSPNMSPVASKNDLIADIQSAISGTSNLTLRKAKSRGEGVSMVFQSSKSLKKNGTTTPPTPTASSSSVAGSTMVENHVLSGDFDPKNFLDQIEKQDSSGKAIPEWRRHVLAKHAAEKAQKEFEEKKQVDDYESRFLNMPAWKRAVIERREQLARDEEMKKGSKK